MAIPDDVQATPRVGELNHALAVCRSQFEEFVVEVHELQARGESAENLWRAWQDYYLGDFAHFDATLRTHIEEGARAYARILPVSISHHNLQRLIEVLRTEIGAGPLEASRIPERVTDLMAVVTRLKALLEEVQRAIPCDDMPAIAAEEGGA